MTKLLISFEEQNVRLGNGQWLFERRQVMRFEWLALLAFRRLTVTGDQAWVTLDEIARLPSWSGRPARHIGTNVGRYMDSPEINRIRLVDARATWAGPYRLNTNAPSVGFDIPLFQVRRRLQVHPRPASTGKRKKLFQFTFSYVRAQRLLFQGRLIQLPLKNLVGDNAYNRLKELSQDRSYGMTLRLLACLSAVDVLYRLGGIRLARQTLLSNVNLMRRTPDLSLRSKFYSKLAWAYQRASTGRSSDVRVEAAIKRASSYAENSGDRDALGFLAYRTGLYWTKKERFIDAVNQLIVALEAYLITGNYDMVQSMCGNIGSVIHRLGPKYYTEARRWLLLSIAIARWMDIGREDAHAEMILGKIRLEQGKMNLSQLLLKRAERVAERAGNRINLADVKMVRGFWYQHLRRRKELVDTLVQALRIFRDLPEFDTPQKEGYMKHSFPEVWQEVLEGAEPTEP